MDLLDILDVSECAVIAGRSDTSIRSAMVRGNLRARKVGKPRRGIWITTREELQLYLAYSSRRARQNSSNGRFLPMR